ncbi:MAG: nuclear transport factor 2 family protein [Acidobacteriota bacterium]
MKPFRSRLALVLLTASLTLTMAGTLLAQEEGSASDPEETKIRAALQAYLTGTSYNDTEQILSAFYGEAELFLSHPERELYILPITEYLEFFADREKGVFNGREGEILEIDRSNDIAIAKAEIRSTRSDARYIDLFLLKKLGGEWKIISKAATRTQ